jgi:hypothetical protein
MKFRCQNFEELVYGWFCMIFCRLVESIVWLSLENSRNNSRDGCDWFFFSFFKFFSSTSTSFFFSCFFVCCLVPLLPQSKSSCQQWEGLKALGKEGANFRRRVVWRLFASLEDHLAWGEWTLLLLVCILLAFMFVFDFIRMDIFFSNFLCNCLEMRA